MPLIDASRKYLAKRGAGRVMAVAPLPGFCQWIVSEAAWHALDDKDPGYSDDQPSAVEAVAKGVPREGHSVLGHGTFTAAQPALVSSTAAAPSRSVRPAAAPSRLTALLLFGVRTHPGRPHLQPPPPL